VDPERDEFEVGEELRLTYATGRDGYASLMDYGPDGRARLLARNRPVSAGFTYTFTGEATLPAGEDFARLVVSQIPLSYASFKSLMEYPFDHSRTVRHVFAEAWVRFTVAEISVFRDPFYRYPRSWGRRPLSETEYYFVQPYRGAVLTRGLSLVSAARICEELGVDEPIDFWLVEPGDSVELRFEVGTGALPMPSAYLFLFMAADVPPSLSLFDSENAALTIEVNGFALTSGYRPRFTYLDDDNTPEVFELGGHLRYGANWIELRVDGFSSLGVRLRRVELRGALDELYWMNDHLFEER